MICRHSAIWAAKFAPWWGSDCCPSSASTGTSAASRIHDGGAAIVSCSPNDGERPRVVPILAEGGEPMATRAAAAGEAWDTIARVTVSSATTFGG